MTESRSKLQYGSVLDMLKEEERDYLRIEKIGAYYVLRLGSFATSREAEDLLRTVTSVYPGARMMTAYISNNRLVKIHRSAAVETPVPTTHELQKEAATVSKENQVPPQQVEVEEAASLTPAEVKMQEAIVAVASPVKPVFGGEKAGAMVDESNTTISSGQFITFVSALTLIMLALFVRAQKATKASQLRRAALKNGQRAEAEGEKGILELTEEEEEILELTEDEEDILELTKEDILDDEPLVDSAVVEAADPVTASTESTSTQGTFGDDNREGNFVEERADTSDAGLGDVAALVEERGIKKTATEKGATGTTRTAATNLPNADIQDNKEESSVKEKHGNRMTDAVEAAMFAAKYKK